MKKRAGAGIAVLLLSLSLSGLGTTAASAAVGRISNPMNGFSCQHDASTPNNNSIRAGRFLAIRVGAEVQTHIPGGGGTGYRGWVIGTSFAHANTPHGHYFNGGRTKAECWNGYIKTWTPNNLI